MQEAMKRSHPMKAPKLQAGDGIRIISPSNSLGIIAPEQIEASTRLLESYGFKVSFAAHAYEMDQFSSSSIRSRVEDIHEAFRDPDVKGILTTLGGHNCNQLLRELDYRLIADNPKRLCGYSDITALSGAIYRKTGLITYSEDLGIAGEPGAIRITEQTVIQLVLPLFSCKGNHCAEKGW